MKLTPERLVVGAVTVVVVLLILAALAWNFDPFDRRKNAEQKAANATAQAATSEVVAKAADTHHTETIVIRERADRAIQTVERAPGASDPVPAPVLAAWRIGLRHSATGSTDNQLAAELPR